jgi:hypothetical protein
MMKTNIILGGLACAMLSGCALLPHHRSSAQATSALAPALAAGVPSEPAAPAKGLVITDTRFASVEGKAFYLFKLGFTCTAPVPGSAPVASWLDKIEVIDGKLIRWGTRCNGEGLPLPPAEAASAKLGADGLTLTIGGTLYHRSGQPTKEAEGSQ